MQKSFLQSDIWGSFRESLGWRAHKVSEILVLERALPLGLTFLYSPEVNGGPKMLLQLLPKIFEIAKRRKSVFYRLELLINQDNPVAEEWEAAFRYAGFKKSFESVQPDDRQIIILNQEESQVLAQMKPKGRYNIRLAEKSGVLVRETTKKTLEQDVEIFYALFAYTAKRDTFSIRPKEYFLSLTQLLYEHNCGRLFVATYQGQPIASAIISLYNDVASYLYGASSSEHRNVMAPYALHWAVMQWAISQDVDSYDLLAIRPVGKKKHNYDGITAFKEQFGGESVHLLGSWDLPLQPAWYSLFKLAEQLRR